MNSSDRTAARRVAVSVLVSIAAAARLHAQAAVPSDAAAVEVFKAPKIQTYPKTTYPMTEEQDGNEGWVHLNFMVDPHGKPYEIGVVDSIGGAPFEKNAIEALQQATFEPATQGSTPVASGFEMTFHYVMKDPATSTTPRFAQLFNAFLKAIDKGDKATADEQLTKLKPGNFYEYAFMDIAQYRYDVRWGTENQQLYYLKNAIDLALQDSPPRYLDKNTVTSALDALIRLELKKNQLGEAMIAWNKFQRVATISETKSWRPTMEKVETLVKSDQPVPVMAEIERGNAWNGVLFRRSFQLNVRSGRVSELKLRCEKDYVFFPYDPSLRYKVSDKVGACALQVVGDNGTSFDVVQY